MYARTTPLVFASILGTATLLSIGPCAAQMSPGTPSTEQTSGSTATGTMSAAQPMSEDDMAKMKACNAMAADEMSKHADCLGMMHAHPDMMKHTNAMKSGG